MIIISYSTNAALDIVIKSISEYIDCKIYGNIRKGLSEYFFDIFKIRLFNKKNIFIYNPSPANLICSFFSKILGSKIIYHLHDPRPHSGILNPILYVVQFFQVLLADIIITFDKSLVDDALKLYIKSRKYYRIFPHGKPTFNYNKIKLDDSKINIGFFGRNMPYKNLPLFLEYAIKNPTYRFFIYGSGYSKDYSITNLEVISGFIDSDIYYSAMLDMDYIFVPYKDLSFSGIIADSISLNKSIIVSKQVSDKYSYKKMLDIRIADNLIKDNCLKDLSLNGWKEYAFELKKLYD